MQHADVRAWLGGTRGAFGARESATPEVDALATIPLEDARTSGARERLRLRFEAALQDWDRHLDRCPECLAFGLHICAEGEFTSYWVETAREALAEFEMKRTQGFAGPAEMGPADAPVVGRPRSV